MTSHSKAAIGGLAPVTCSSGAAQTRPVGPLLLSSASAEMIGTNHVHLYLEPLYCMPSHYRFPSTVLARSIVGLGSAAFVGQAVEGWEGSSRCQSESAWSSLLDRDCTGLCRD